jgi:hypothetical protein
MNIHKIELKTPFLSLYLENEKGLLFNQLETVLYELKPITVAFFLAIDDGLSEYLAIQEISHNCNMSPSELLSEYHKAKALFTSNKSLVNYADGRYPELNNLLGLSSICSNELINTYIVGTSTFGIACDNSNLQVEIEALLKPIEKELKQVHFKLIIKRTDKCCSSQYYDVFCNDLLIERDLHFAEVVPVLIDRMQILTFQHSDFDFCFHGAALKTAHGNLLLPGKSGAGKSTLSAALTAKQNELYSDEMIVLDKNFHIKVLPLPIAVKSGSWDVLSSHYPELNNATQWQRIDGRKLKYVWPAAFSEPKKTEPYLPSLILAPQFCEDGLKTQQRAQKLSVIETITMLTEAGYQVGSELDEANLERFIDFILNTDCYRFSYNKSEQAESELDTLWSYNSARN